MLDSKTERTFGVSKIAGRAAAHGAGNPRR